MGENTDNRKLGTLEPSETKLGDNKIVGRNYMVTFGLFRPHRYDITNYLNYDITKFKDHFTACIVIKHRDGEAGLKYPMYFHGATNKYEELPVAVIKQGERLITNPELEAYYINN